MSLYVIILQPTYELFWNPEKYIADDNFALAIYYTSMARIIKKIVYLATDHPFLCKM